MDLFGPFLIAPNIHVALFVDFNFFLANRAGNLLAAGNFALTHADFFLHDRLLLEVNLLLFDGDADFLVIAHS